MSLFAAGTWAAIGTAAGLAKTGYDMYQGKKQQKQMKSDQKKADMQPGLAEERARKIQRDRMMALASGGRQSTEGGQSATLG